MFRTVFFAVAVAVAGLAATPAVATASPYANCSEAHADGRYNIPEGDPAHWKGGDRDRDGYACE